MSHLEPSVQHVGYLARGSLRLGARRWYHPEARTHSSYLRLLRMTILRKPAGAAGEDEAYVHAQCVFAFD